MKVQKYRLKQAFSPVIENNKVIKDTGINGELTVYTIKTGHRIMTLFGKDIHIFDPSSSKTSLFFRPYKSSWDNENYPLKPNQWGKKAYPMTNLIINVPGDLKETRKKLADGTIVSLGEIKDTVLSKRIREKTKVFIH